MAEPDPAPKRRGADSKKQAAKPATAEAKALQTDVQNEIPADLQSGMPAEIQSDIPATEQNQE